MQKDKKEKVQRKLRMAEIQLIKEDLTECERLLGEIMKEIYSADQKTDSSVRKNDPAQAMKTDWDNHYDVLP